MSNELNWQAKLRIALLLAIPFIVWWKERHGGNSRSESPAPDAYSTAKRCPQCKVKIIVVERGDEVHINSLEARF